MVLTYLITTLLAAQALPGLRRYFPTTPLQGKGLLATEGVVSFPLWGQPAPVAAVTSHFLEFEALEDDGHPVRLLHELREGAAYAPLLAWGPLLAAVTIAYCLRRRAHGDSVARGAAVGNAT